MKVDVEYSREEVDSIILKRHIVDFGAAPKGEEWVCSGSYGERKVKNCPIAQEAEKEEDPPSDPPPPDAPF